MWPPFQKWCLIFLLGFVCHATSNKVWFDDHVIKASVHSSKHIVIPCHTKECGTETACTYQWKKGEIEIGKETSSYEMLEGGKSLVLMPPISIAQMAPYTCIVKKSSRLVGGATTVVKNGKQITQVSLKEQFKQPHNIALYCILGTFLILGIIIWSAVLYCCLRCFRGQNTDADDMESQYKKVTKDMPPIGVNSKCSMTDSETESEEMYSETESEETESENDQESEYDSNGYESPREKLRQEKTSEKDINPTNTHHVIDLQNIDNTESQIVPKPNKVLKKLSDTRKQRPPPVPQQNNSQRKSMANRVPRERKLSIPILNDSRDEHSETEFEETESESDQELEYDSNGYESPREKLRQEKTSQKDINPTNTHHVNNLQNIDNTEPQTIPKQTKVLKKLADTRKQRPPPVSQQNNSQRESMANRVPQERKLNSPILNDSRGDHSERESEEDESESDQELEYNSNGYESPSEKLRQENTSQKDRNPTNTHHVNNLQNIDNTEPQITPKQTEILKKKLADTRKRRPPPPPPPPPPPVPQHVPQQSNSQRESMANRVPQERKLNSPILSDSRSDHHSGVNRPTTTIKRQPVANRQQNPVRPNPLPQQQEGSFDAQLNVTDESSASVNRQPGAIRPSLAGNHSDVMSRRTQQQNPQHRSAGPRPPQQNLQQRNVKPRPTQQNPQQRSADPRPPQQHSQQRNVKLRPTQQNPQQRSVGPVETAKRMQPSVSPRRQ